MDANDEARRRALLDVANRHDATAVLLRQPPNFAWFTRGADNRVDRAGSVGAAAILVTEDDAFVVTDNIEAERLRDEEVPGLEIVAHDWYTEPWAAIRDVTGDVAIAVDAPAPLPNVDVTDDVQQLRCVLDGAAIERYVALGADAVDVVERAMQHLSPEHSEAQAAALIGAALASHGMAAPVLLCAGGRRLDRYRHPLPTREPLGDRAMVVVCAERGGLYANFTRFRHFSRLEEDRRRRMDACREVLHELRARSRPGRTLADLHEDCRSLYREAGLGQQWQDHHQGGLTGYRSREVVATPSTNVEIRVGHAFAWNPSTVGAKAEETFVVTEDGAVVVAPTGD